MPKPTTSEWIKIKNSKIHGVGIFAAKNIPKKTKIIEYVGDKVTKKEGERRAEKQLEKSRGHSSGGGVYVFELDKKYDVDGSVKYNTARFINHSCDPNCITDVRNGKIWIKALKNIKKGAELSYDYGYDMDSFEAHPCFCGTKKCVGYIVDEKYRKRVKKKLAKASS